jgi:hypothetical protein
MDRGGKIMRAGIITIAMIWMLLSLVYPSASEGSICDCCNCKDCVVAFYFHGNLRCVSCRTIEAYTKEVLESCFKEEIAANKICLQVVNTEKEGSEHFIKDYGLYTKAVVLSLVKNGKEVKFDNLQQIWELMRNKEKFQQYIKNEVSKYLKEL